MPTLTCHLFGKGYAYYVATRSNAEFYQTFIEEICTEAGIEPIIETPAGVEVTRRSNKNGTFLFFLNHDGKKHNILLNHGGVDILTDVSYEKGSTLSLSAKGVAILRIE